MSLLDSSNGILGTSVTWATFEENIRSALNTQARLGQNKSVVDIGEGNGFVSCCGMIACDWVGAEEGEQLPSRVVLKIPSHLPMKKVMDALPEGQRMYEYDDEKWKESEEDLKELHNTELAVYDFFEEFDGLIIPRRYYGVPMSSETGGQMCMEYMENSTTMKYYENNSVGPLKQIARSLGKIRACWMKNESSAPELCKDYFETLVQDWTLETFRGMFKGIHTFDSSEKTKLLMDKIDALLPTYYAPNIGSDIRNHFGFRPLIFNADSHTSNILVDRDSGDLLALIDWQCVHLGAGVEDIHQYMISALSAEDRRSATPMLLEEMYASLVENLDGIDPPYSLETLLLLSDLLFPPIALFFVGGFMQMLSKLDNETDISEEEKSTRKAVTLNKIIGTLEDIVELDTKNKTLIEKIFMRK